MGKLSDFLASNKDADNEYQTLIENAKKEAREEGITSERARMSAIDQIAGNVSQELVHNAKYVEPINAEQLALMALQNGAVATATELNGEQPENGVQTDTTQPELAGGTATINMEQIAKMTADFITSNAAGIQSPAKNPLTGVPGTDSVITDQMAKDASASVSKYL